MEVFDREKHRLALSLELRSYCSRTGVQHISDLVVRIIADMSEPNVFIRKTHIHPYYLLFMGYPVKERMFYNEQPLQYMHFLVPLLRYPISTRIPFYKDILFKDSSGKLKKTYTYLPPLQVPEYDWIENVIEKSLPDNVFLCHPSAILREGEDDKYIYHFHTGLKKWISEQSRCDRWTWSLLVSVSGTQIVLDVMDNTCFTLKSRNTFFSDKIVKSIISSPFGSPL